jgi:hypothetical protein
MAPLKLLGPAKLCPCRKEKAMIKKLTLLFALSTLLTRVGIAQEGGWTTLPAGETLYDIRYDQNGAVILIR